MKKLIGVGEKSPKFNAFDLNGFPNLRNSKNQFNLLKILEIQSVFIDTVLKIKDVILRM